MRIAIDARMVKRFYGIARYVLHLQRSKNIRQRHLLFLSTTIPSQKKKAGLTICSFCILLQRISFQEQWFLLNALRAALRSFHRPRSLLLFTADTPDNDHHI